MARRKIETVLVIDDEPNLLRLATVQLERAGYRVESALSGAEGIDKARYSRPDAILCDVMMPGLDGFEVMRILRADPTFADVYVVLMTARSPELPVPQYAGFDGVVVKPWHPLEIVTMLQRLTESPETSTSNLEDDN